MRFPKIAPLKHEFLLATAERPQHEVVLVPQIDSLSQEWCSVCHSKLHKTNFPKSFRIQPMGCGMCQMVVTSESLYRKSMNRWLNITRERNPIASPPVLTEQLDFNSSNEQQREFVAYCAEARRLCLEEKDELDNDSDRTALLQGEWLRFSKAKHVRRYRHLPNQVN